MTRRLNQFYCWIITRIVLTISISRLQLFFDLHEIGASDEAYNVLLPQSAQRLYHFRFGGLSRELDACYQGGGSKLRHTWRARESVPSTSNRTSLWWGRSAKSFEGIYKIRVKERYGSSSPLYSQKSEHDTLSSIKLNGTRFQYVVNVNTQSNTTRRCGRSSMSACSAPKSSSIFGRSISVKKAMRDQVTVINTGMNMTRTIATPEGHTNAFVK